MNNNEAKRVILEVDSCFCKHGAYKDCHSGCKYREALDAAVKALEQEPTAKNDLGVDCVSRADALDCVNWGYSFSDIYKKINELPSVTPQEPKIGHWEYGYAFADGNYCKCSECKEIIKCIYPMHYCPNCGAKMFEPQAEKEQTDD